MTEEETETAKRKNKAIKTAIDHYDILIGLYSERRADLWRDYVKTKASFHKIK